MLQAQHEIARENWSGIETNLQNRISSLEQESEDNVSREAYLRKKVKSLTDSLKTQTSDNETLNDEIDELKSQQAKLQHSKTQIEEELETAKKTILELESSLEKQASQYEKKLETLQDKLKVSIETLNQQEKAMQQRLAVNDRKRSSHGQDPFLSEPISRSESTSPFSQRFSSEDVAAVGARSPSLNFGRRASSKTSLPSLYSSQSLDSVTGSPGFSMEASLSEPTAQFSSALPTHLEDGSHGDNVDDDMEPYGSASDAFRAGSTTSGHTHTRDRARGLGLGVGDEASVSKFDNASVSTVGAGPSIQLVNRMSRTIRGLESELANVKQDLAGMTSAKDEAVKDVARLMQEAGELEGYKAQVEELERRIEEMSVREQTALEMLGEKSEQVNELRADVADIKDMFQQQIEELVGRLNAQK